jgi:hypothetical protein
MAAALASAESAGAVAGAGGLPSNAAKAPCSAGAPTGDVGPPPNSGAEGAGGDAVGDASGNGGLMDAVLAPGGRGGLASEALVAARPGMPAGGSEWSGAGTGGGAAGVLRATRAAGETGRWRTPWALRSSRCRRVASSNCE